MDDVDTGSNYRWWICGLLFVSATICYLDRQVIAVLQPTLHKELGFSQGQYADIVFWFQATYAAGYLLAGRLNDVLGVKRGYALSVGIWSLAAMAHAFAKTVGGFSLARGFLGISEGGNFPASIRTVSEWFPRRERSFATGIFNAGTNVGVVVSALMVPWITLTYGWPAAFLATGVLGLIWLVPWLTMYRDPAQHPRVSRQELALIRSDPEDPPERIPWLRLLEYRSTWAFAIGMALSSPIWWFYLFWTPDFLNNRFGIDLKTIGPPLIAVYVLADVGSVAGGWLPSALMKRGASLIFSRKAALLTCALCVVPVVFASKATNAWVAIGLIGLAAAAHQGWSANLYTLVSDTTPRKAVSSVVGFGGMCGSIVGMFFSKFVGYVLEATHNSYVLIFAIAPCAYLIAWGAIQMLVPNVSRATASPGA